MRTLALLVPLFASVALAEQPAAPEVAEGFVLRPAFFTETGSFLAGTAFAVQEGDRTVVLTAYHLFGPAGGLPAEVPPAEVGKLVREVLLRDAWTDKVVGRTERALLLEDAAPLHTDASRDLVVFPLVKVDPSDVSARLAAAKLRPGKLATTAPKVGDPVYVAAEASGVRAAERTFRATLVEVGEGSLYYQLEAGDLDMTGMSGAPVLAADGSILGMHLGGGAMEDGALIGVANPASRIRARITQALKSRP
jgi:hypothetical protein